MSEIKRNKERTEVQSSPDESSSSGHTTTINQSNEVSKSDYCNVVYQSCIIRN